MNLRLDLNRIVNFFSNNFILFYILLIA